MKAQEIAEECKKWISKDDFEYVFHPEKFDKFVKQLIKERDEQWKKMIKDKKWWKCSY